MGTDVLKIGLALSGGGVRATVFHFGVLGRLSAEELLESVTFLSTVSGGSLGTGLVYTIAGNRWPTSQEYLETVAPKAKRLLTQKSLQSDLVMRTLTRPWHLLRGRAKLVSESIQHQWGVTGPVRDVPRHPHWIINATTYETGKNWRFAPERMGDYMLGHVLEPSVPLADAMAASAAYPGGIGYLALKADSYEWVKLPSSGKQATTPIKPAINTIHLYDGGVYDNLGVEALYKSSGGYREGVDFLIVSDAAAGLLLEKSLWLHKRALRLVSIAGDQVRSLRARDIVRFFGENPQTGAYLRIGNTAKYILTQGRATTERTAQFESVCLPQADVSAAATMATTLRKLRAKEYERLYRHGWEVADCTLSLHCPDMFRHLPFTDSGTVR